LSFAGLGFLVMLGAANRVIAGGATTRVSMLWLVASYFLQGIGELSLSPVGMSSMTRLAPKRFSGLTMGAWFTSIALGNLIAGIVGGNVDPEKLTEMPVLFQRTAVSLFVAAALLLVLVVPIRRMMARTTR
jgi:proton-dependent oligopeptide transporter, POT family